MFSAPKQARYDDDNLATYMFSFIKEGDAYDNSQLSIEIRDLLEECQTYIYRDRPLQINAAIEAELEDDTDSYCELMEVIYEQDTATLCNIVKIRNHIFQ